MNNKDLNTLFICAFRYALGRSSYITSEMCDLIWRNRNTLDNSTIKLMIKEIDTAIEANNYGMEMDKKSWITLRNLLI